MLPLVVLAAASFIVTPSAAAPDAYRCEPTLDDGAGPFGRAEPPLRGKIGRGHVLTGVVLSALDCNPIRNARVQLWQANRRGRYTTATSGTVVTNRAGRFRFEGPYPSSYGPQPHIHIRVHAPVHRPLLTRYVPRPGARGGRVRLVLEPEDL